MRISIIGISGAGKTTLAKKLSKRHEIPPIELDAFRHGPRWVETPDDQFHENVQAVLNATGEWVCDGNYNVAGVRDLVWTKATHVIYLDMPKHTVMRRVIWRSLVRAATKRELWNGNREKFSAWVRKDHPIRWAYDVHGPRRDRESARLQDPRWGHLEIITFNSPREVRAWLRR